MQDKSSPGLAWSGRRQPRRSGGFVDGIGLNERAHVLAVDPDGVADPERGVCAERAGPHLNVDRIEGDEGELPLNGRVRLP